MPRVQKRQPRPAYNSSQVTAPKISSQTLVCGRCSLRKTGCSKAKTVCAIAVGHDVCYLKSQPSSPFFLGMGGGVHSGSGSSHPRLSPPYSSSMPSSRLRSADIMAGVHIGSQTICTSTSACSVSTQKLVHVGQDLRAHGAVWRGKGHRHKDLVGVLYLHAIDET